MTGTRPVALRLVINIAVAETRSIVAASLAVIGFAGI